VVSSSPPSSPLNGGYPPGHAHAPFAPAFAYPPTCPYCHHCLHCYYSGGSAAAPAVGAAAYPAAGHGPYPPPPPPPSAHHHRHSLPHHALAPPVSASYAAAKAWQDKEVLAQWARERPYLPPLGMSSAHNAAPDGEGDDDDDDASGDNEVRGHAARHEAHRGGHQSGGGGRVSVSPQW
jgi:hypothetical protein